MKAINLFLLIFFFSVVLNAQETPEKLLHGKVVADTTQLGPVSVRGINVINLVNEKATVTDKNGEFYILAKADDLLVLSAVNFEYKRRLIETEDFAKNVIIIKMVPKITELDEVVVNEHSEINAVNLGIIPKGQKKYTPAERRLYTARSGPVDIIANMISGRTKMLKKEVEVEKKERLLAKVRALYTDQYYIETLKIPEIYIGGFQYFLIDDPEFLMALNAKNKALMQLAAAKLALKYKDLISSELKEEKK